MKFRLTWAFAAALLCVCIAPAAAQFTYRAPDQPEGSSGFSPKPGWAARTFAVAAANPIATDAGYQILKAGGSAVDAAIAVQMVLALVEPQSSGIDSGVLRMGRLEIARLDNDPSFPERGVLSLTFGGGS